MNAAPELTAVTVAGPLRERAARAIAGLAAQSAVERIESVIVDTAPAGTAPLQIPPRLNCTVVEAPGAPHGEDRAIGVRRASGGVVALIEDHSVAEPGWAEALIEAHRGPWAVVGYAFKPTRDANYVSRCGHVTESGLWMSPVRAGPTTHLPGTNVSYKREALLRMEDRLGHFLLHDHVLQAHLLGPETPGYLEPKAVITHENLPRLSFLLAANYGHCRLIGAGRAAGWSLGRRIAWGLGTPISAPLVRAGRLLGSMRGRPPRSWSQVGAALPVIALAYAAAAIGESLGYLRGAGSAPDEVARLELATERVAESSSS